MQDKKKLLFICTYNISRSRTGEDLFASSTEYEAKSAGIKFHSNGNQVVSQELIDWADIIVAMNETVRGGAESKPCGHFSFLEKNFNLAGKTVSVFNIPDNYGRGDPYLIKLIKDKLKENLGIII